MINGKIFVDNFAGGGGASTGIELSTGIPVDIAINHDKEAVRMHQTNHPHTKHYCEDVWEVDPVNACNGRKVALAWFSPDCKHFSKAKGGTPVSKKIRGLAWVALKWAGTVKPDVIMLENVEEFQTWGPVRPKRDKKTGRCIKYTDEMHKHTAVAEKGEVLSIDQQVMEPDPNRKGETFKRFINQVQELGYKVEYKELVAADFGTPTMRKRFYLVARCDGKPIVWPERTHAPRDSKEVKEGLLKPYIPVSDCLDFSLPCPSIFDTSEEIKQKYGIKAVRPLAENTLQRIARGIKKFVLDNPEPFILQIGQTGFSKDRNKSIHEPLSTVVSKNEHCLVTPTLIQYHSETSNSSVRGQSMEDPVMTLDGSNRYGLVTAYISKYFAGGYKGAGAELNEPSPTVTAVDHNSLCTATLIQINKGCDGRDMNEPINTIVAGDGHFAEVRAFLVKYYSDSNGQDIKKPIDTVTANDRFGLVTVHGIDYKIVDIGLRMLTPKELYRCQGFPEDYIIDHDYSGKSYPRTEQVKRCGNAVCPPVAAALVKANLPKYCVAERTPNMQSIEEPNGQIRFA